MRLVPLLSKATLFKPACAASFGLIAVLFLSELIKPSYAVGSPKLQDMPTPKGLEGDVRFWEKVFSKYKKTQCVFHDKTNLTLIFGVANIPKGNPRYQNRVIKKHVKTLKATLRRLGEGKAPRSKVERVVYNSVDPELRTPAGFRAMVNNVRCQRGVELASSIARSRQHLPMIKSILAKHGLPLDLAYLPHLESGYQQYVRSRAGARGLWQLMPATARLQGLKVTSKHDARTHPRQATVAAARYLRDLYEKTGSWPLTITGYNYGPNGTMRAIRKWGKDYMVIRENHKTSIFGFAARNYYPSFLAVRNVASQLDGSQPTRSLDPAIALEDDKRLPARL